MQTIWINPLGGLGDTLMLSGVLKQCHDLMPEKKFNLVRRTKYLSILEKHPAIETIGFPAPDTELISAEYWTGDPLGPGPERAFQRLAKRFGLPCPAPEELYMPDYPEEDTTLLNTIPWRKKNILLAIASDSPRKMMIPNIWHDVVEGISGPDTLIIQVGKPNEIHIKGTYSILGLTNPRQLRQIVDRADAVLTVDNFVMHLARLCRKPAVVCWGPTWKEVYGYDSHLHITAPALQCPQFNSCLGPDFSDHYAEPCPMRNSHCMNQIHPKDIIFNVKQLI